MEFRNQNTLGHCFYLHNHVFHLVVQLG